MVQIIGPSPASQQAAQVGGQVGGNFGKALGFMKAQNLMQEGQREGDATKIAMGLGMMGMASPGMDRSLGPMYESMMSRMGNAQLSENLTDGNNNPDIENEIDPKGVIAPSPDVPSNTPANREIAKNNPINFKPRMDEGDIFASSQQFLRDTRSDLDTSSDKFTNVPTFDYEIKSDLRPEEEKQLRQQMVKRNVLPETQDKIVQRTREDIKTRFEEAKEKWNIDKTVQQGINEKWNSFKNNASGRIGQSFSGYGNRTQQDFTDKYFQYAQRLPVNMTPEEMHTNAWTQVRRDMNQFDALAEVTGMPYIRDESTIKDYINNIREAYKPLKDKGYIEALKEDAIDNKGMGIEEMHAALWGEETDPNSLQMMAIDAPLKFIENKGSLLGGYQVNKNYEKQHESYVNGLSKNLKKIKPEDDLVLLRAQVLDKHGTEKDFTDALNTAQEDGLKLSPFQESQLQEIRIPRTAPIWQIFDPLTWPKYLRNMRGKK